MSVDRNYIFQILTTSDRAASRSEAGVTPEKNIDEGRHILHVSRREPSGVANGSNNIAAGATPLPRAALIPETDNVPSATDRFGEITSQSTFSELFKKPAEFSNEPAQFPADVVTGNQGSVVESSKTPTALDAPINTEFGEQMRRLESSFRAQAAGRQNITETLSVIRQIREMLSEQQREGVTRQELKRELQTLRLVMEGRK